MNSEDEAILGVLQGRGENCGGKDGGKTESIPTASRLMGIGFLCNPDTVAAVTQRFSQNQIMTQRSGHDLGRRSSGVSAL